MSLDIVLIINVSMSTDRQKACPLCGVNRKGKESCCYRGGAWFKKCGDPGENAEHTWNEGTQACKGGNMFNLINRYMYCHLLVGMT